MKQQKTKLNTFDAIATKVREAVTRQQAENHGQNPPRKTMTSTNKTQQQVMVATLIPGQAAFQKDLAGRPIAVGDRVEDTECHGGGIVVGVYGTVLIYLCDYHNGDVNMGTFTYARCDSVRVLPPVTNVAKAAKEVLARRAKLDKIQERLAKSELPPKSTACTRIEAVRCVDENGRQIDVGDIVLDHSNEIGGIVVGVAGRCIMFRMANGEFDAALANQCISSSATPTPKAPEVNS